VADKNGLRESFLSLDLFSLTYKNIFLALIRGRSLPPPAMDLPLLQIGQCTKDALQSIEAQHHKPWKHSKIHKTDVLSGTQDKKSRLDFNWAQ